MIFNSKQVVRLGRLRCHVMAFSATMVLGTLGIALNAQSPPETKTITVNEGTDLAITVSSDHKTIVMDLQGMLYLLPMEGGEAKLLTTPVEEASHPDWSPKGDSIALQSYIGGTFHIWTMRPDGTGLKQITFGHGDDR